MSLRMEFFNALRVHLGNLGYRPVDLIHATLRWEFYPKLQEPGRLTRGCLPPTLN